MMKASVGIGSTARSASPGRCEKEPFGNSSLKRPELPQSPPRTDKLLLAIEGKTLRQSVRIDESLKIGFSPSGLACAAAPAGERPQTFSSRARAKAKATKSPSITEFCSRWATKWEAQNPHA